MQIFNLRCADEVLQHHLQGILINIRNTVAQIAAVVILCIFEVRVFTAHSTLLCWTVIWQQNCQAFYVYHKYNSPNHLAQHWKFVMGGRTRLLTKYQWCSARTRNCIVMAQRGNQHIVDNRWVYNFHYFRNFIYRAGSKLHDRILHSFIYTGI